MRPLRTIHGPLLIIPTLLCLCLCRAATAAIGATDAEDIDRYGKPTSEATLSRPEVGSRLVRTYSWRGFDVAAQYAGVAVSESRCVRICYRTQRQAGGLTTREIEELLSLNTHGGAWKRIGDGWHNGKGLVAITPARNPSDPIQDVLIIFRIGDPGARRFPDPLESLPPRKK